MTLGAGMLGSARRFTGTAAWMAVLWLVVGTPGAGAAPRSEADLAHERVLLLYSYHPGFKSTAPIALERFGLDASALSPGSEVLNAPDEGERRLRRIVMSTLLLLAVLGVFAGYLVWLLYSRRRHEELARENEERYRILVENAPEAILVIGAHSGRVVDVNDNALKLFNTDRERFTRRSVEDLHPRTLADGRSASEAWRDFVAQALSGKAVTFDWIHCDADGHHIPTEVRLVRLPSTRGVLVRASVTDMTERRRAEQALREKSLQLEGTLENIDQGISMMNAELQMVAFNQRFLELLGFPRERFSRGDPFSSFVRYNAERGEYGDGDVEELVRERIELALRFEDHAFVRERPDGTVLEIRGKALPDGGMVSTYTDITETHRLSEQLTHQASHDALTALPNRREFERRLGAALEDAREDLAAHAMCYLDLDQFKVINDTCGHMAGDDLLRQLAGTLRTHIRRQDTLSRLGGDEFGVLLRDCDILSAQRIAGKLRGVVEEFRFAWEDKTFRVGVSIGLVPVGADSGTVADVLSAADSACYAAKDQGRNRVHVFREDDVELASRQGEMQWVLHIQRALEEDRFRLDFQRIVPVARDVFEGDHYELLLRMEGQDGESVAPGVFLPAAERYNLIGPLDRWVVSQALQGLASDPARLRDLFLCSINLSGHSLADDEFLDFVQEQFRVTAVPPERICFEVTETAAIANLARAQRFMSTLKTLGCSFALDDFGSGLSSFAYLKTLPVDFLKIDGVFVKDIVDDPIDRAMVKSINEVGHVMGKRTIAEFVENEQVLACLRELEVDYAQGYGIGRPRPLSELTALPRAPLARAG